MPTTRAKQTTVTAKILISYDEYTHLKEIEARTPFQNFKVATSSFIRYLNCFKNGE